ncbi:pyrimidine 5'-nucleotidase [Testudinibacter sp. TR-2022]|uniref:pyrimidine 5'-nucleotidase n=1 Tax=Testudinibacter sp. TR-2022 TaxID=2585029 RepID=UPI001119EAFC|nr:pyrimidine 5'-nucleotidase [Testudinibacter sp. TR-2022]TNH08700.1 pyrimidine 5'-nucleotidase [Pasteurellaceae bacterium Phil11]TNH25351.1 pyrimidine 5'-nucleotidase [Testudinibacter sp. TR-2022]TNH27354.1 pyrimidine 5'-nucleotidase [Testudinibacter sp. TR-2022]
MKYQWIFFDADETLFSFDSFRGLQQMFAQYDVEFTQQHFADYQTVNQPLWQAYHQGKISADELQTTRFNQWAQHLSRQPSELNQAYLIAMADICQPLDGVEAMLQTLSEKVRFGIITNGFNAMQDLRLQKTGLKPHFEFVVVSENIGLPKPHHGIFQHALNLAKVDDKSAVLMVGDTLETDILGGQNSGLDTCWLSHGKVNDTNIQPTYQIANMEQLVQIAQGGQG